MLPEATFWATAEASATAMANPRRCSRALRNFGAGGWPVGLPETFFRSFCDNLPRARFRRFGAREWPDGLSERSFRATQSGGILDAAAAYAARSLCRNTGGPDYQGRGPGQWPQWPFYQPEADKWSDRMADFILSRIRSLSAARPSHFYQGLAKRIAALSRPASRSGRFIKADGSFIKAGQPMAVLSTMAALSRLRTRPQWPFCQSEAAKSPNLLDLGCGWADFILSRVRSLSAAKASHF